MLAAPAAGRWGKEGAASMVLDGLVAEIERVKATIVAHRELLAGNEALTRYALIDPLLRALEWDTGDPAQVRPELVDAQQRVSDRRPRIDYVLMQGDRNIAVIEAKRLQEALEGHVGQAVDYGSRRGTKYTIITDGSEWRLYNTFEPIPLEDRVPITDFNIANNDTHAVALKALHLWRPNLSAQSITAPPDQPSPTPPPPPSCEGWRPLSEVANAFWKRGQHPTRVRFADGSEATVKSARTVFLETAKWLVGKGKLTSESVVQRSVGKKDLVNPRQEHTATGEPFRRAVEIKSGIFVDTARTPPNLVHAAVDLLKHCGVDPATVHLRFDR